MGPHKNEYKFLIVLYNLLLGAHFIATIILYLSGLDKMA